MSPFGLLVFLVIGALAGWLAGKIVKGSAYGLIGNIAIGIAGAVTGGFLFGLIGISFSGLIGHSIGATAGAVILLSVLKWLR